MKMKVRKTPRPSTSFLHKTCVKLCYTLGYIILLISMINAFHAQNVNADTFDNDIDSGHQSHKLSEEHYNSFAKTLLPANRTGRFLFDTFFDISPSAITADDEFDEVDEDDEPKPCKCGE